MEVQELFSYKHDHMNSEHEIVDVEKTDKFIAEENQFHDCRLKRQNKDFLFNHRKVTNSKGCQ